MSYALTPVDLTNCDREPIHVPGSVQAHGFLLALKRQTDGELRVEVASQNAGDFLQRPLDSIFGADLPSLLGEELADPIHNKLLADAMAGDVARFIGTVQLPSSQDRAQQFQLVGHQMGDLFLLEFERADQPVTGDQLNSVIANFVASLEEIGTASELCQRVAAQVRALTGFDRTLLYRFDEDGHGIVLAEDRNDRLPSFLGLRFPASDIPAPARNLYVLNRTRIIPDVEYEPSPLLPAAHRNQDEPIDLSYSVLRSVSPIHRDYMRNMGTPASMSISIVSRGRLWGLISGHHSEPRSVSFLVRSACDVLSRITSSQLAAFERSEEMSHAIRLKSVHGQLLTFMAAGENYIDGLVRHPEELFAVTGAAGAAVFVGDRCALLGETPPEDDVCHIAAWLAKRSREDVFATSKLSSEYPGADAIRAKGSGLLAISLSQVHRMQILWFRPEVIETVHWAGEPGKNQEVVEGVLKINPRNSFASWKQVVHGQSQPWKAVEIESAREFRSAVLEIVLKRAEELADMASELEFTNKELEAFSYSVSHDLRAPFRHISGFAELLLENEASRLSDTGKRHLGTIAKSAQFAGLLVDSLLNFSRITRTKLELQPVEMKTLVQDVWRDVVQQELKGRQVEFNVADLPAVEADINLLRQVWRNLLSNAAKYTRKREDAQVSVQVEEQDGAWVFSVTDNGVGFDNQYAHKLFGAFQRLHRVEDFEGTGIGLANARRIVARHGGKTWAKGEEGKGASFYFTLPRSEPETP